MIWIAEAIKKAIKTVLVILKNREIQSLKNN